MLAAALLPGAAAAQVVQAAAPIVPLGAIEATSTETVRGAVVLHALSNGGAIVADVTGRRVIVFDQTLANARVVMDSAAMSTGPFGAIATARLIPYLGDSALFVDMASQSLLVLGPDGNVVRVMAVPVANDIFRLAGLPGLGGGAVDPQGRIIYRTEFRQPMPTPGPGGGMIMPAQPDSAPIVRADFESRRVDTIGVIKIPVMARPEQREFIPSQPGTIRAIVNPMATGDEWGVLSDGTLAMVRTSDYHVDWVDPDGTRRSSPRMRFDWRRVTDDDKQHKVDSLKRMIDSAMASARTQAQGQGRGGAGPVMPEIRFVPFSEMPDYHPPIRPGSVMADRDGNLWIVPTTSSDAQGGLLYDVVRRTGEAAARVQLPAGRVVAGFGPGGVVYLLQVAGGTGGSLGGVLERARVKLPDRPTQD